MTDLYGLRRRNGRQLDVVVRTFDELVTLAEMEVDVSEDGPVTHIEVKQYSLAVCQGKKDTWFDIIFVNVVDLVPTDTPVIYDSRELEQDGEVSVTDKR